MDDIDHMLEEEVLEEEEDFGQLFDAGNSSGVQATVEDLDDEIRQHWIRPPVQSFNPAQHPIVFQQLEVDYTFGSVIQGLQCGRDNEDVEGAVMRLYGVTDAGNSVCAFVHGFRPYFYIQVHPNFTVDDAQHLKQTLNNRLRQDGKLWGSKQGVLKVEVVNKCSLWKFQTSKLQKYAKITLAVPNLTALVKKMVEGGVQGIQYDTYESNVIFELRFMIDNEITGANWLELPPGKYVHVPQEQSMEYTRQRLMSHCQINAHIYYTDLISHQPKGQFDRLAPFRTLSVDIECAGEKGHFPQAERDPIIMIASYISVQGQSQPHLKNVLTLKGCTPIVGAEVLAFDSEADLLMTWMKLLKQTDPDFIIGYNISNFDLPYMYNRAEQLKLEGFKYWGRIKGSQSKMREASFSSKAYGTRKYKEIRIEGRVQLDLLVAVQRDHKLSSYSLNNVSAHFLNERKEDVHHSAIGDLWRGTDETRQRLAVYCLKDAYLPQRLVDKLMYMYNYVEMARVTGVPINYLLTKGQSIKVFSQILRKTRNRGYVVPALTGTSQGEGVAYEGATVFDPLTGYYKNPIATLDFASLYPSIMMAHNLCYTTWTDSMTANNLKATQGITVPVSPSGDLFVSADVRKGILPEILEELLSARKRAKKDLKEATDPFVKAVMNGRQLALKVSANSVYGFTGATVGKLCSLAISRSTTAYGRQMIDQTKSLVERRYTKANGFEEDCTVIYGDTDSVMVNFKVEDINRAMQLGKEAADEVSKTFPPPVKLEFEKVYYPYLLMNKKRYAGLLYTQPEKYDKMDTKGIETVRRDNCLVVRQLVETCLDKLLIEKKPKEAEQYVKSVISDLLQNRLDLSLLVISKSLAQETDQYKAKSAHVELVKKMRQRDMSTAPTVGDRVPFVIIKGSKNAKAFERAEDPIFALEHGLPIDSHYYLEHHLKLPIQRLFEPVLGEKRTALLFSGDHTKVVCVSTPTSAMGGMMGFLKKGGSRCMGCRAILTPQNSVSGQENCDGAVCIHCKPNESVIYLKTLSQYREQEQQFSRLWTQCQRCQGSLLQDVICTARDCPIFYRRTKVRKDLDVIGKQLHRFDW